jgi:hypothetical protein
MAPSPGTFPREVKLAIYELGSTTPLIKKRKQTSVTSAKNIKKTKPAAQLEVAQAVVFFQSQIRAILQMQLIVLQRMDYVDTLLTDHWCCLRGEQ